MSLNAVLPSAAVDIGPRAALHVLNRLGFGPTPGGIREVLSAGLQRYVEDQLSPAPDADLDRRLAGMSTLRYSIAQVLAIYNNASQDNRAVQPIVEEFAAAKLIRAVHSRNQLQEVLVDFWFNHFNVNIGDGFVRYSIMSYERDAIRPHVLGRFRDLLGATAAHPAMLFYLDNYLSTVSRTDPRTGRLIQGLNENYGRELMELHTIGVDAGYTQEHVFDAARCFTGWGIDNLRTSGAFIYRPANHDTGAKSVFGLNLAAGGQRDDGERLLDYLASHPSTASRVSRKLAERFVSDDPPRSLVAKMAAEFLASDGDIASTLRAMIGSAEFWAEAFGPGKARTPIEYVIGVLRALDAQVTNARGVGAALTAMGQPIYACIPPTGYSNRGVDWLNPSSHLHRMNFALDAVTGQVPGVSVDVRGAIRDMGGVPDDRQSAATAIARDTFGGNISRATYEAAIAAASSGAVPLPMRLTGLLFAGPEMQVR